MEEAWDQGSVLLVNKKMQIKATRYSYKPIRLAKFNNLDNTAYLEEP